MAQYAAVIPAAGLSSRMGAFKPLLALNGKPMIDHVIDTFEAAGAAPIVLVTGHRAEELRNHLKNRKVTIVFNENYAATHMMDSIKIGLAALKDGYEGVFITPGDVPLFSVETLDALIKSGLPAVRPVWQGSGGHPVFLRREAASFVGTYDGPGGLRGALEELHLRDLCLNDQGALADADTPEDFKKLQALAAEIKTQTTEI